MKIQIPQKRDSNLYFTSDLHFHHKNILKFTDRKNFFNDVDEMNEGLIERWNKKVSAQSSVIIAGDFSFGSPEQTYDIFSRLNGYKFLAMGNHDSKSKISLCNFIAVGDVLECNFGGSSFFIAHYAHRIWNKSHYGTIHLYGHSHGTLPDDPDARSMDCGVDCHPDLEPFSFEEIKAKMRSKRTVPIDHHKLHYNENHI